jgi:hypothetical protein
VNLPERVSPILPTSPAVTGRTPVSGDEIRGALSRAIEARGEKPSPAFLDVLVAHVSHETAGGKSMVGFNFGGIKGASPNGGTTAQKTHEVLGGKDVTIVDNFRAYGSLDEGAKDYVGFLERRYSGALGAAQRGEAGQFAQELGKRGYYTAPVATYQRALERWMDHPSTAVGGTSPLPAHPHAIQGTAGAYTPPGVETVTPTVDELARVMSALDASAARIMRDDSQDR